jgi:hypothetical protein
MQPRYYNVRTQCEDAHFGACRACVYMRFEMFCSRRIGLSKIALKFATGLVIENNRARKILKRFRAPKHNARVVYFGTKSK